MFDACALMAVVMPTTWPLGVDERPAAVAEADRGVGLDVGVQTLVEELAAEEADDADRDRVDVAERVADRADPLADAQRVGIAERRHRQRGLRRDLEERDVDRRIDADDLGAEACGRRRASS